MTLADVHFSSATDLWSTPQEFFDSCDKIFRFAVDVCAPADNAKCAKYFTPEDDGLKQEWTGTCWCNPPYGRGIGKWMRKAWESRQGRCHCRMSRSGAGLYAMVA